ncbi:MAG: hypothetical protein AAGI38_17050 [Bacteroidota bacterium]
MKIILKLFLIIPFFNCFAQQKIPIDSVQHYIIPDSTVSSLMNENQFIELENTEFGLVVYCPSSYLLQWNLSQDTLTELIGFEFSDWAIIENDTMSDGKIIFKGICPSSWGKDVYSIIELKNTDSLIIYYKRSIHHKMYPGDIIEKETLITKKTNLNRFVCLKEPNPYYPGTRLPFIPLDPKNFYLAKIEDFKMK